MALQLAPVGGDDSKDRRVPLGVRQPGSLPERALYTYSLVDD